MKQRAVEVHRNRRDLLDFLGLAAAILMALGLRGVRRQRQQVVLFPARESRK